MLLGKHQALIQSKPDKIAEIVRYMHEEYVEPSKIYADVFIREGCSNEEAVNMLVSHLETLQEKHF